MGTITATNLLAESFNLINQSYLFNKEFVRRTGALKAWFPVDSYVSFICIFLGVFCFLLALRN